MISMDLEGIMPWMWKECDGFGGFQALDLEGLRWIWSVPGLGFGRIYMDLEGPNPIWALEPLGLKPSSWEPILGLGSR